MVRSFIKLSSQEIRHTLDGIKIQTLIRFDMRHCQGIYVLTTLISIRTKFFHSRLCVHWILVKCIIILYRPSSKNVFVATTTDFLLPIVPLISVGWKDICHFTFNNLNCLVRYKTWNNVIEESPARNLPFFKRLPGYQSLGTRAQIGQ